ncbi:hypothetical protein H072_3452 [Dactylellina haptotyla CBS 200.50]|uniref:Uncharacterized protein n=1 Tax=Dactylellina haptotyla (strain CBS 200.50) TaxID=1284197 RepID=S8C4K1_DACHA|nr:hypothetical protein H072_3452 [Dactylellina haptotyla CBS 200.50]
MLSPRHVCTWTAPVVHDPYHRMQKQTKQHKPYGYNMDGPITLKNSKPAPPPVTDAKIERFTINIKQCKEFMESWEGLEPGYIDWYRYARKIDPEVAYGLERMSHYIHRVLRQIPGVSFKKSYPTRELKENGQVLDKALSRVVHSWTEDVYFEDSSFLRSLVDRIEPVLETLISVIENVQDLIDSRSDEAWKPHEDVYKSLSELASSLESYSKRLETERRN